MHYNREFIWQVDYHDLPSYFLNLTPMVYLGNILVIHANPKTVMAIINLNDAAGSENDFLIDCLTSSSVRDENV